VPTALFQPFNLIPKLMHILSLSFRLTSLLSHPDHHSSPFASSVPITTATARCPYPDTRQRETTTPSALAVSLVNADTSSLHISLSKPTSPHLSSHRMSIAPRRTHTPLPSRQRRSYHSPTPQHPPPPSDHAISAIGALQHGKSSMLTPIVISAPSGHALSVCASVMRSIARGLPPPPTPISMSQICSPQMKTWTTRLWDDGKFVLVVPSRESQRPVLKSSDASTAYEGPRRRLGGRLMG
jgi:hypothetical protein